MQDSTRQMKENIYIYLIKHLINSVGTVSHIYLFIYPFLGELFILNEGLFVVWMWYLWGFRTSVMLKLKQ